MIPACSLALVIWEAPGYLKKRWLHLFFQVLTESLVSVQVTFQASD